MLFLIDFNLLEIGVVLGKLDHLPWVQNQLETCISLKQPKHWIGVKDWHWGWKFWIVIRVVNKQ